MDSDLPSPIKESDEAKAEFRKLTNDAAARKYRRRSPVSGSSDEDGSPKRDYESRGNQKIPENERRNDKHSSRGYHSRHDDYSRRGKYADEDDRGYAKPSSRSVRESRGGSHSDYRDRESDYNRSRDHYRDDDKYSRDADRKYKDKDLDKTRHDGRHGSRYEDRDRRGRGIDDRDEKRDSRSSRDHRTDRTSSYEDSRSHRSDTFSKRGMSDLKDLNGSKYSQEGKSDDDGLDRNERKHGGDKSAIESEVAAKRTKFSSEESDAKKDERQTSGSKQGEELAAKVTSEQASVNGADSTANVDAAKVAAMKAAELFNKNLIGTGIMTADQKKKLLWGSKKNSSTEESSHRWDSALFTDRERQDKFNKLMGVKGDAKTESKSSSSQDAEKQREVQLDLEKQYTAGLRRRDGRTVGLGL